MIKSPLRYPGGKSRAVKLISNLIPSFEEYREPFLGGGSLFVYLKQLYPTKRYWINDIYFELYKFWCLAQNNPDALIKKIRSLKDRFLNGKELHRYLIDNINSFEDEEIASAFFILNRITFSGTSESGGFSNQSFQGRFTESSIERVELLSRLLYNIKISNLDYAEVVEEEGDNVFIFLDPPYYSAAKSALYGKNGKLHKNFDHEKFAEVMKKCNHKWLITYDDSDYIKELFSFAKIFPWDLKYGMRNVNPNSSQIGKELFISNYLYDLNKEERLMLFDKKRK
ncbi:MAG: DNA adenine methylase [Bacteroidota bacterium]|nr:DNA adenine methylase [Bacteroidota bacterium]